LSFARILVCVDGSESSRKAAQIAVDVAKHHGAELYAINVIVSQVGYSYSSGMFGLSSPSGINELLDRSSQEASEWFSQIKARASEAKINVKTEMLVSPTSVVPAIVDYAERNRVDLIITGTKGRSGLTKLVLGSIASGVVTHASCPVMVVK
jgi:nucleotide-binding universal stress UspA family protein